MDAAPFGAKRSSAQELIAEAEAALPTPEPPASHLG